MIRCPVACVTLRARSAASARLVVLVPLFSSVPLVKHAHVAYLVRIAGCECREALLESQLELNLVGPRFHSVFSWFEAGAGETELPVPAHRARSTPGP